MCYNTGPTNIERPGSRYTHGEMVDVLAMSVDHQSARELGRCEPKWVVGFVIQLELCMNSAYKAGGWGEGGKGRGMRTWVDDWLVVLLCLFV